ncbi:MAG TPA: hypothetical protein VMJ64_08960 [Anaerolineales bacterium]|nr:hypothetical protein [Anaerolineales bacterium]
MQTARPRVPVWLIVVYVLALGTVLLWPFVAFMSVFAFDAPGSAEDPAVWRGVVAVLAYPLLPVLGILGSYFAYRGGRKALSYILAVVGALPLLALVLALIAIAVGNAAYLLGGGI